MVRGGYPSADLVTRLLAVSWLSPLPLVPDFVELEPFNRDRIRLTGLPLSYRQITKGAHPNARWAHNLHNLAPGMSAVCPCFIRRLYPHMITPEHRT